MKFLSSLFICLCFTGCATFLPAVSNTGKTIAEAIEKTKVASEKIKEISDGIDNSTVVIDKSTESIRKKVPQNIVESVSPDIDSIVDSTKSIRKKTGELKKISDDSKETVKTLNVVAKESKATQKELTKLKNERDEALSKQRASDRAKLMYLILAGIVMVAGSLAMCIYGIKAIGVAIFGIVLIVSSLTVSFMIENLAYVGFGGGIVAVGIIGYSIWRQRKERLATKEIVHTAEIMKNALPKEERNKILGNGATPGLAYQVQSDSTERIVRDIRSSFKPSWEKTVNSN